MKNIALYFRWLFTKANKSTRWEAIISTALLIPTTAYWVYAYITTNIYVYTFNKMPLLSAVQNMTMINLVWIWSAAILWAYFLYTSTQGDYEKSLKE
jgi:hypothetical protein